MRSRPTFEEKPSVFPEVRDESSALLWAAWTASREGRGIKRALVDRRSTGLTRGSPISTVGSSCVWDFTCGAGGPRRETRMSGSTRGRRNRMSTRTSASPPYSTPRSARRASSTARPCARAVADGRDIAGEGSTGCVGNATARRGHALGDVAWIGCVAAPSARTRFGGLVARFDGPGLCCRLIPPLRRAPASPAARFSAARWPRTRP